MTWLLLLKVGSGLLSSTLLLPDVQWYFHSIVSMFELTLYPLLISLIPFRTKVCFWLVAFALFFYNLCQLFQYICLIFGPKLFILTFIIFAILPTHFIYFYVVAAYSREKESYNPYSAFLVYKKPGGFWGCIGLLFLKGFGHRSLVINGREFTFKEGTLIEREFLPQKELTFVKINFKDISEARALVGQKWSIKNNCITVFSKFNKE